MEDEVFVYGTLKTGQCRENAWPIRPRRILRSWTLGRLHDIGPYPALTAGNDRVLGEVWIFDRSAIHATLSVLDQIEGTNQPGFANEYDRVRQPVFRFDSEASHQAHVYLFADPERLKQCRYVSPHFRWGEHTYAVWPAPA